MERLVKPLILACVLVATLNALIGWFTPAEAAVKYSSFKDSLHVQVSGKIEYQDKGLTQLTDLLKSLPKGTRVLLGVQGPGGSLETGLKLMEAIQASKATIAVYAAGNTASMSSILLCSLPKRHTIINKNIIYMHHPYSVTDASGPAPAMIKALLEMNKEYRAVLTNNCVKNDLLTNGQVDRIMEGATIYIKDGAEVAEPKTKKDK